MAPTPSPAGAPEVSQDRAVGTRGAVTGVQESLQRGRHVLHLGGPEFEAFQVGGAAGSRAIPKQAQQLANFVDQGAEIPRPPEDQEDQRADANAERELARHSALAAKQRLDPRRDGGTTMMNGIDGMFTGMWGMGLTWLVLLVLATLGIAALIKYLGD